MDWDVLKKLSIFPVDSPNPVDNLVPKNAQRAEFDVDEWVRQVQLGSNGGNYLAYVADNIGPRHGGMTAVHLRTPTMPGCSRMLNYLIDTGLRSLVIVDPFYEDKFALFKVQNLRIAVVGEDPLWFMSQIENGPSILFNPFYAKQSFPDEQVAGKYYQKLTSEMHRLIAGNTNVVRGREFVASGIPLACGVCLELFEQMIPPEQEPEQWRFHPRQMVGNAEGHLIALAASGK